MSKITQYMKSLNDVISDLPEDAIQDVIDIFAKAFEEGKHVFFLGNGGSASNASHIACDLQKGLKTSNGKRSKVMSLTDNMAIITAWANDTDYDNIFAAQLDSLLDSGDVVVAISGSGNSANIIKAVEKANEMGAITIGWSGYGGGKLSEVAQKSIVINSDNMQRIEDIHLILGHCIFSCMMGGCELN